MSSDIELVAKAIQDPPHFRELVSRYERSLFFFIRNVSQVSPQDAEDIIQETFITAWKYLRAYNPKYSFKTWIYRIARQQAIQHYRRSKHMPIIYEQEESELMLEHLASDISLEESYDHTIRKEQIQDALSTLPEISRSAIVLRYMEDMSYEEISDTLKKPVGSIATLIYRAKDQLKSYLEKTIL